MAPGIATAIAQEALLDSTVIGAVRDVDTGVPVPNATVVLTHSGTRRQFDVGANESGRFQFKGLEPGVYFAHAEAAGYVKPSALGIGPNRVLVESDAGEIEVEILVHKAALIEAKVLDADSEEPLSNVQVRPLMAKYLKGRVTFLPVSEPSATGSNGVFRLGPLPPGEIVIELSGEVRETPAPERLPDFDEENPRPSVFARTHWPPGANSLTVPAITLRPGSEVDLGQIAVRKRPVYRLRGQVRTPDCHEGGQVQLSLRERFGATTMFRARGLLPCQTEYSIANRQSDLWRCLLPVGVDTWARCL